MKFRIFAAALAVPAMMLIGVGAASATVAPARPDATPQCGTNCEEVYAVSPGHNFVLYDKKGAWKTNNPIHLMTKSNTRSGEDFAEQVEGEVGNYCNPTGQTLNAGIVSDTQCLSIVNSGLSQSDP